MTRPYTVREYGPGYCRNGHHKPQPGKCPTCRRREVQRRVAANRARRAAEKRRAVSFEAIEEDVKAMRRRVAERRAA